jgi:phospholipase D1/2
MGLLPAQKVDGTHDLNAQPVGEPNDPVEDEQFEKVADPMSDELWEQWTSQATLNTELYRDMFHADPDNSIKTFDDYKKFLDSKSGGGRKHGHLYDHEDLTDAQIKEQLGRIRGHLVWMPLDFLDDAEMAERGFGLNSLTDSLYT